jgi:hypothetical protein
MSKLKIGMRVRHATDPKRGTVMRFFKGSSGLHGVIVRWDRSASDVAYLLAKPEATLIPEDQ